MKFALVNDEKVEATKRVKGFCPCCGSELIAKCRCGEVKVNHWSHKGNRNCDPWWENETEWHRSWKGKFPKNWQEVIHFDGNAYALCCQASTVLVWTKTIAPRQADQRITLRSFPKASARNLAPENVSLVTNSGK